MHDLTDLGSLALSILTARASGPGAKGTYRSIWIAHALFGVDQNLGESVSPHLGLKFFALGLVSFEVIVLPCSDTLIICDSSHQVVHATNADSEN